MGSLLESRLASTLPGASITSSDVTSPATSASLASGAGASTPAYAPAAEENRAYAGVGDSAQSTTTFSSPTCSGRLRAFAKALWGTLVGLASYLYAYINRNLFALIALPAFFLGCMWLITTLIDAPRRAAWMRALASGQPRASLSLLGCGLCGTRFGWYVQQQPITHAVEPAFTEKDIPDTVPARGPASALSPMPEPFMYVRVYDTLMALVARATGYTQWAPAARPSQGASAARRVKQMQKFRFTDLAATAAGSPAAAAAAQGTVALPPAAGSPHAWEGANPLAGRRVVA